MHIRDMSFFAVISLITVLFSVESVVGEFNRGHERENVRVAKLQTQDDTSTADRSVQEVFQEFETEVEETSALFREMVEALWNEFRESTKQSWVDYSEDISSLNEIDFKEGNVTLEAVIPVSDI